jgi:hypothetical protein
MAEEETLPVQEWAKEITWNREIRKNVWVPETRLPEPHVLYSAYEFRSADAAGDVRAVDKSLASVMESPHNRDRANVERGGRP